MNVVDGLAPLCLGNMRLHQRLDYGFLVIWNYERVKSTFVLLDFLDAANSEFKPELFREGKA